MDMHRKHCCTDQREKLCSLGCLLYMIGIVTTCVVPFVAQSIAGCHPYSSALLAMGATFVVLEGVAHRLLMYCGLCSVRDVVFVVAIGCLLILLGMTIFATGY